MRIVKSLCKLFIDILTVILFVLLGVTIYAKVNMLMHDTGYSNYFGFSFFKIISGSMSPAINVNDIVVVKLKNFDINVDDVVSYVENGTIVTHRVIYYDKENKLVTLKGDNNNTIDKPIKADLIIGKIVKVIPKAGIWQSVLSSPVVLFALFVTIILFDIALSVKPKEQLVTSEGLRPKDNNLSLGDKITPFIENVKNKGKVYLEQIKSKKVSTKKEVDKSIEDDTIKIVKIEDDRSIKNDVIEKDDLLALTRNIAIDDIVSLLDDYQVTLPKEKEGKVEEITVDQDVQVVIDEVEVPTETPVEEVEPEVIEKDEYTVRLDLNKLQKMISNNIR